MEKTISENLFADYTRNGVLTLFMDNLDTVRTLAPDLRTGYPRSPRETLAGYVLASRIVDKGRAALVGQLGEYHYGRNPSLDTVFFDFTGLTPEALQAFLVRAGYISRAWRPPEGRESSRPDAPQASNDDTA